ncbi:MAG: prepilin-type N-terminal cleavage/methylation domain-containing protein [Proteobacteria bacterium]|nr:prepilin-type N-terminal cleavage/methylation domain-containing protein [Pseudomonadota bacterium]
MKKETIDVFVKATKQQGFTLLEVVIATAILGIGVVMVMQLFAGGLRTGRISREYTNAVIHAKAKMEEMITNPVQGNGEFSDGLIWQSEVNPHEFADNDEISSTMITVKIYSHNDIDKNIVELSTLKILTDENKI